MNTANLEKQYSLESIVFLHMKLKNTLIYDRTSVTDY